MINKTRLQAPSGMHDILPEDQQYYQKIYSTASEIADFYGFQKIDTPILEDAELFSRGVGLTTDMVEKQMYTLKTRGGDSLALRPEFTAAFSRAYMEHGMFNLPQPVKLFTFGPLFRYERPQLGRFRQFHQIDLEAFGEGSSVIDAQIIQIFYNILKELKFKNIVIEINSIGDNQCRPYYKKLLTNYLKARENSLCSDCRRRIRENPLRVLDCKEEKCQPVKAQAPQIIDHLCEGCKTHFKQVLEFLDEIELPYRLNPYLVRGLDYYTKTVFEFFEDTDTGKNLGALVGGGRFDGLAKILGGKDTPACGAAAGVERMVQVLKERIKDIPPIRKNIFLAQLGDLAKRKSLRLYEDFRKSKILIAESLSKDSLKTQLRSADRLGASYTLILGQREALEGTVIVRDMKTGRQDIIKIDKVVGEIKKRFEK